MNSDTEHSSIPEDEAESDLKNCQMRKIACSELIECVTKDAWCKWALPFGNSRFCNHPAANTYLRIHPV